MQNLTAAVQADPQNWRAYQVLGNCLYHQDKLQAALTAFDQSLAIHPDNPKLKSFAESLRSKLGGAPPVPVLNSSSTLNNPPPSSSLYSRALEDAQSKVQAEKMNPQDHSLLTDFYAAKLMEERSREGLKLESENQTLAGDEQFIAKYGAPQSDYLSPHFTLDFGILTPTFANLDLGVFLDPTTNLGLAFFYVPLPTTDYEESLVNGNYYISQPVSIPGDLIYLEPRIKFYSAPSGLTTYQGFSFIYFGLHQGSLADGYQNTDFDVLGLGYLFGFRTLPMDGFTMELGWKLGVAVIFVHNATEVIQYNGSGYTTSFVPTTTTVPFPYILPEFRFGFTF